MLNVVRIKNNMCYKEAVTAEHNLMDSTRPEEAWGTRRFWRWIWGITMTVGIVTVTAGRTLVSSYSFERRYREGSLGLVRHRSIANHNAAGEETSIIRSINSSGNQDTGGMQLRRRMHVAVNLSREGVEHQGLLKQYLSFAEYVVEMRRTRETLPLPLVVSMRHRTLSSIPLITIIGVQKGGTTNLRANLLTHPLVSGMPNEIHFFDQDPNVYPKLGQWPGDGLERDLKPGIAGELLQQYSRACLEQGQSKQEGFPDHNLSKGVMVESCPRYMLCPLVPYRMKMVRPEAKMVVVLRDPTERYFSHLRMVMCKRHPDPGFQSREEMVSRFFHPPGWANAYLLRADNGYQPYTALCRGENATASDLWGCYMMMHRQNPLFRGLYADQLERWFRVYDPSQFFILDSAKMFANFTDAVKRVAEFAGLPAHDFRYSTGHEFRSVCKRPQGSDEPDFFAPDGMYDRMTSDESLIREWYRPHNERLFRLLGRDFGWNS